ASYYATVHRDRMCIEYFQRPFSQAQTARAIRVDHAPPRLLKVARDRRAFVWSDISGRELHRIVRRHVDDDTSDGWIFLVCPVIDKGDLLALWVRQYSPTQVFFEHSASTAAGLAAEAVSFAASCLLQRRFAAVIVEPIFKGRDTRVDLELAFILMPFKEDWSARIWERLIRPTVEKAGLRAVRADDLYGRDIMEDIWAGVLRSRLVIADITSRNANVFYELGVAHTLGKPVILLAQSVVDIPFDLNRYRHIIYQDNMDGYDTLRSELTKSIADIL